MSKQHTRLIAGLSLTSNVSDKQSNLLASLPIRTMAVERGAYLRRVGDRPSECCFLSEGILCRQKQVGEWGRQILSIQLPGDISDLHILHLQTTDFDLLAFTASEVAFIPHNALRDAIEADATLADILVKHAAVNAAIAGEWLANIGKRPADHRIAHLICETFVRMRALGLAANNVMSFPLTQSELADATGMSGVNVSRVLKALRQDGYIAGKGSEFRITDWERLRRFCDFSSDYLHLASPTGHQLDIGRSAPAH